MCVAVFFCVNYVIRQWTAIFSVTRVNQTTKVKK